jgi:hypothetical protein
LLGIERAGCFEYMFDEGHLSQLCGLARRGRTTSNIKTSSKS